MILNVLFSYFLKKFISAVLKKISIIKLPFFKVFRVFCNFRFCYEKCSLKLKIYKKEDALTKILRPCTAKSVVAVWRDEFSKIENEKFNSENSLKQYEHTNCPSFYRTKVKVIDIQVN